LHKNLELDSTQKIFGHLEQKPFSLKKWFNRNITGILGTLIFHVFLLIIFLVVKIQALNEKLELGVTIDFSNEKPEEVKIADNTLELTPAEAAFLERLLAQSSNISNIASNIAEKLEREISTENYVDMVEKELDQSRSDDWKRQQEEINEKLNQEDFVPEKYTPEEETDIDDYKGLTNITYEFLEPPFNRFKTYLPVPVYKCQGAGTVYVEITVDQSGRVLTSRAFTQKDFPDKDCMIEIAQIYASRSRFEGNLQAPKVHKARIIYKFIAQ